MSYIVKIKNNDTGPHTWGGLAYAASEERTLTETEVKAHREDASLLSAISAGTASVGDGTSYFAASEGTIWLMGTAPTEVTTQFEKNNITLKLASDVVAVNATTGEAVVQVKVPGVMANGDGRYVDAGEAWFTAHDVDDQVLEVSVVDVDNVLGYGAGFVLKTYHDEEVPAANQGWRMSSYVTNVDALGGYGFLPAELYFQIKAKKDPTNKTGKLYLNLKWGKAD